LLHDRHEARSRRKIVPFSPRWASIAKPRFRRPVSAARIVCGNQSVCNVSSPIEAPPGPESSATILLSLVPARSVVLPSEVGLTRDIGFCRRCVSFWLLRVWRFAAAFGLVSEVLAICRSSALAETACTSASPGADTADGALGDRGNVGKCRMPRPGLAMLRLAPIASLSSLSVDRG
jgi:hypothetical protein